jgi:hypothetical protein
MRNYAQTFGAAVRQRTNRQETTMARHGTLPEIIYQRHLDISADKVQVGAVVRPATSTESGANDDLNENDMIAEAAVDTPEYGSSSDEETAVMELDRHSTFLVVVSTRSGRQVRINNRLFS